MKKDLQSNEPMDRLLCGDVGYGKTEVAMRAAFKAVSDGRQVAVLVPTTVLAFQHLSTFQERFAAFPVRVEMLSRFKSRKEQKAIVNDLAEGKVDILRYLLAHGATVGEGVTLGPRSRERPVSHDPWLTHNAPNPRFQTKPGALSNLDVEVAELARSFDCYRESPRVFATSATAQPSLLELTDH